MSRYFLVIPPIGLPAHHALKAWLMKQAEWKSRTTGTDDRWHWELFNLPIVNIQAYVGPEHHPDGEGRAATFDRPAFLELVRFSAKWLWQVCLRMQDQDDKR